MFKFSNKGAVALSFDVILVSVMLTLNFIQHKIQLIDWMFLQVFTARLFFTLTKFFLLTSFSISEWNLDTQTQAPGQRKTKILRKIHWKTLFLFIAGLCKVSVLCLEPLQLLDLLLFLLGVETVAESAQIKQFEQQNVRLKEALVK